MSLSLMQTGQSLADEAQGVWAGQTAAVGDLQPAGAAFAGRTFRPAGTHPGKEPLADLLADGVFFLLEAVAAAEAAAAGERFCLPRSKKRTVR